MMDSLYTRGLELSLGGLDTHHKYTHVNIVPAQSGQASIAVLSVPRFNRARGK